MDPDGDIVRPLRQAGQSQPFEGRPCYHTDLDTFSLGAHQVGIVGRVVGASFAVLVAKELFASSCRLLVALTSAGQITPAGPPPYFVVIDRGLRDEGTSYHYAPASEFAEANPELVSAAAKALATLNHRSVVGSSWTTDAPFREAAQAIAAARAKGILAVEMEAAALYAFARGKRACPLSSTCHQYDGDGWRRLRKGRSGWLAGCACHHREDGDRIA